MNYSCLIEHFNTINQTVLQALPHEKLVVRIEDNNCEMVQRLEYKDRCHHVLTHESCDDDVDYFHYIRFFYCVLNPQNEVTHFLGVFLLIFIMSIMFLILAETTDKFFCPALTALAKWLKMNENIAGLTLLAFGNGAPDVFTSIVAETSEIGMVFSEAFGGACLVSGLTVAIIAFVNPCPVYPPTFLRDILFFLLGIFLIDVCTLDGFITIIECAALMSVYFCFIIVVLVDLVLNNRRAKDVNTTEQNQVEEQELDIFNTVNETSIEIHAKRPTTTHVDPSETSKVEESVSDDGRNKFLWEQFKKALNPLDAEDFKQSGYFLKLIKLLKAPISVVLTIIIPLVDLEEENNGWSKLLNSLQIVIIPQVFLLMQYSYKSPFIYVTTNYPLYFLGASLPIAAIIFALSRTDEAPFFHPVYCLISIGASIFVIAQVAQEVVNILFTIGMASNRSKSFLAVTLLGLGNSVADMLANPSLAKQGYPKMGLAACYGGPMFNILMGLSIIFIRRIIHHGNPAPVFHGLLGPNAMVFLQILLGMTVFALLFTNFKFRRSIGAFLLTVFCVHILYAWLGEFNVIHPFGTNHDWKV